MSFKFEVKRRGSDR